MVHTSMSMHHGRGTIALAVLMALVPAAGSAASPDASASPVPRVQPVVRVLDPGAEPRAELRYRYPDNAVVYMTMDMDMRVGLVMDDGSDLTEVATIAELPTMTFVARFSTGDVAPDGSVRSEFEYVETSVDGDLDDPVASTLAVELRKMEGISGWSVNDARGGTLDSGFDDLDDLDPALRAAFEDAERTMDQISAPLPLEPVGVGARWELTMDVVTGGAPTTQTARYTLVERDGDRYSIALEVTQTGEPGPMELQGTTLDVLEMRTNGTGSTRGSLDEIIPRIEMDNEMLLTIDNGGTPTTTVTTLRMFVGPTAAP